MDTDAATANAFTKDTFEVDPDDYSSSSKPAPPSNAAAAPAPGLPGSEPVSAGAPQGDPVDPALPQNASSSKATLVQAVQTFLSSIKASNVASDVYNVNYAGKTSNINQAQYDKACKDLAGKLSIAVDYASNKGSAAEGLYDQKKSNDKEWWLTSHVVNFFGRVKDPGPYLQAAVARAKTAEGAARSAIGSLGFEAAAVAMSDCEEAATEAQKLSQAYFEGSISAGEMQIKILEGVEQASKDTLFILSIIASAGGSAAVAGAIGAVGTTAMETVDKASLGKPIDWAEVTASVAIELVMVKFGGGLSESIEKEVTARLVKESATKFTKAAITKVFAEIFKKTMQHSAEAALKSLSGKEMTGGELASSIGDDLKKQDSIMAELVKAAIETAEP